MLSTEEKNEQKMQENSTTDFHGAAIIDSNGHEVPITEEMVQKACEELEENRQKS
ncbi:MAG: hypothetical protein R3E62_05440 [Pseudomonadales bacterium]|jgi:hypothetical protein